MLKKKWVMGLWRFSSNVDVEVIFKIADKLAGEDARYLEFWVRQSSNKSYLLELLYDAGDDDPPSDTLRNVEQMVCRMSQSFLGNSIPELVDYEVSYPVFYYKALH